MSDQKEKVDKAEQNIEPLLVGAKQAAAMCGISLRLWWRQSSMGLIPKPLKIGRKTLWRVSDLKLWVELELPNRERFEDLKKQSRSAL